MVRRRLFGRFYGRLVGRWCVDVEAKDQLFRDGIRNPIARLLLLHRLGKEASRALLHRVAYDIISWAANHLIWYIAFYKKHGMRVRGSAPRARASIPLSFIFEDAVKAAKGDVEDEEPED